MRQPLGKFPEVCGTWHSGALGRWGQDRSHLGPSRWVPSRSGTLACLPPVATHWMAANPLSPRMRRRIPQTAPTGVPWAWLAARWVVGDHNPSAWTHTCLLTSPQPVPMSSLSVGTAPRMGSPARLPALYYGPSTQASPSASASRNSCLLLSQARPTPW